MVESVGGGQSGRAWKEHSPGAQRESGGQRAGALLFFARCIPSIPTAPAPVLSTPRHCARPLICEGRGSH